MHTHTHTVTLTCAFNLRCAENEILFVRLSTFWTFVLAPFPVVSATLASQPCCLPSLPPFPPFCSCNLHCTLLGTCNLMHYCYDGPNSANAILWPSSQAKNDGKLFMPEIASLTSTLGNKLIQSHMTCESVCVPCSVTNITASSKSKYSLGFLFGFNDYWMRLLLCRVMRCLLNPCRGYISFGQTFARIYSLNQFI